MKPMLRSSRSEHAEVLQALGAGADGTCRSNGRDAIRSAYRAGRPSTTTPSAVSPPRGASTPWRSSTSGRDGCWRSASAPACRCRTYRRKLEIVGIDLSPEMLEKAHERVAEDGLTNVTGLHEMDAGELKFPDASFDTVVAMYVMTVVPDPEKVMRELVARVPPGRRGAARQPLQRRRRHARLGGAAHGAVRRQARLAPGVRRRARHGVRAIWS